MSGDKTGAKKLRYAVAGLGHISQMAVLPAFAHASENSELTGFISSDPEKVKELEQKYGVQNSWSYQQYDEALRSGKFDAVYIALPNHMHREFTEKAAKAGIHVLCEKPMALSVAECKQMISACESANVKLMIAYRLHFEEANMKVVELVRTGKIGEPRFFSSTFSLQVRQGNIRTNRDMGGGPLMDIGIYCINAARYVFQEEPIEVMAIAGKSPDPRFAEIEEIVGTMMRFSNNKIASFVCSFGAVDESSYRVVGSKGTIQLTPCYDYATKFKMTLEIGDKKEEREFEMRDQFAPELTYFSNCVLNNLPPEPSGVEGLADLRVIEAIRKSAASAELVKLGGLKEEPAHPGPEQVQTFPPVPKQDIIKAKSGSQ